MRRNLTTIAAKLEHHAAIDKGFNTRLGDIESRVEDAAEVSEGAQDIAQSLLSTMRDSFGRIELQKEELQSILGRRVNDIRNRLGTVENMFNTNVTRLQAAQVSLDKQQRKNKQLMQILGTRANFYVLVLLTVTKKLIKFRCFKF